VDTRRLQAAYNEGEREFTFAKTVVLRHKKTLKEKNTQRFARLSMLAIAKF